LAERRASQPSVSWRSAVMAASAGAEKFAGRIASSVGASGLPRTRVMAWGGGKGVQA